MEKEKYKTEMRKAEAEEVYDDQECDYAGREYDEDGYPVGSFEDCD